MRCERAIILHFLFASAHVTAVQAQDFMDELVDKLVDKLSNTLMDQPLLDRALRESPLHQARDLDETTLQKPGHVAMPPRASLLAVRANGEEDKKDTGKAPGIAGMIGMRGKISNQGKAEDLAKSGQASKQMGFRFDPAKSQWIRDDKGGDTVENWKARGGAVNTSPMSGGAYVVWPAVYVSLLDRQLPQVTGEEALQMVQSQGAILVDVDRPEEFQKSTMEGAINVPLYRQVQGSSLMDNIKRISMASIAMTATERDPDFLKYAEERLPKNKPLIIADKRGGSLSTVMKTEKWSGEGAKTVKGEYEDPDRAFGIESRSLKACYELLEAGYTKIYFLKGGINQYNYDKLPMAEGVLQ